MRLLLRFHLLNCSETAGFLMHRLDEAPLTLNCFNEGIINPKNRKRNNSRKGEDTRGHTSLGSSRSCRPLPGRCGRRPFSRANFPQGTKHTSMRCPVHSLMKMHVPVVTHGTQKRFIASFLILKETLFKFISREFIAARTRHHR